MWQQFSNQGNSEEINNSNMVNYNSSVPLDVPTSNNKLQDFSLGDYGFEAADFDTLDDSDTKGQQGRSQDTSNNSFVVNNSANNDASSVGNMSALREWHSEDDLPIRMDMTHRIMQLLQDRKKEPCQKGWLQELPHKALKLEKQLYKAAPSLQAYMDESTLKHRLRKVANAITTHVRLKKANAMQRRLASSLPPNWNAPNVERRSSRVEIDAPPLSQVITNNNVDSNSGTNNVDQTQLLGQMLDMQRTLNNLMKMSSMNGTDVSSEQHQLQQQMLDMQNQLNQMNRQSLSSVTFPAINDSLSTNSLPSTNQNNSNNDFTSSFNSTNSLRNTSFNAGTSRNASFNSNSSCNSIEFNANSMPSGLNNMGPTATSFNTAGTNETASNDGDLDIDFLQETFGSNNNVAV